jgi:hypothetical protein
MTALFLLFLLLLSNLLWIKLNRIREFNAACRGCLSGWKYGEQAAEWTIRKLREELDRGRP